MKYAALFPTLLFAAVSLLGWQVFRKLRIPAAPILGGTLFAALASLGGLPLSLPSWLRFAMSVTLGISIGGRFRLRMDRSLLRTAILFLLLIVAGSLGIGVIVTAAGVERQTAMFASLLGGLTEMTFLSQEFGFDSFQVSIFQTFRMCMLLVLMPLIAQRMPFSSTFSDHKEASAAPPTPAGRAVVLIASVALAFAFGQWGIPAGKMIGAAIPAAAWSRLRNTAVKLPTVWHGAMLSFIGGSTGMGVTIASIQYLPSVLLPLLCYSLAILAVIVLCYAVLRRVGGLDPRTALFSATLGGLSPSIALAETMKADSSVVSSFQVIRYFTVIMLALVLGHTL